MKKISIVVCVISLLVLASIPLHRWIEEYKWDSFAEQNNCKLVKDDLYQCKSGDMHKPSFNR